MIYYERMQWAINELRSSINLLETNNQWYQFVYDSFHDDTKAWISHIRDNLTVEDAWVFFSVTPLAVRNDSAHHSSVNGLLMLIHTKIHLDISFDYFGVNS